MGTGEGLLAVIPDIPKILSLPPVPLIAWDKPNCSLVTSSNVTNLLSFHLHDPVSPNPLSW